MAYASCLVTPNDEDLIVYGRLRCTDPDEMQEDHTRPTLQLIASRIAPASPLKPAAPRMPRPDDPSPRMPDHFASMLLEKRNHKLSRPRDPDPAAGDERNAKRAKPDPKLARAKELMLKPPAFSNSKLVDADGFRVPGMLFKSKSSNAVFSRSRKDENEKEKANSGLMKPPDADLTAMERANKTVSNICCRQLSD